ncbi:hypothetical protein LTR22_003736 [Elasticomyces elasticus]|nr:hypothetical protein LTR22_003736 [Elasticomyces elasticus]KAK4929851.1 hypothetical protein LTR49_003478 [Elasticomyces elasticus]KAK5759448.1 hypothetical protein LTS12_010461 [Elasticomyces elasticus]
MASRYVPPALRRKEQLNGDASKDGAPPKWPTEEIDQGFFSLEEITADNDVTTGPERKSRTLHDSAATPGQLAYLLLFEGANPRWDSDKIVFTKSALDMLPPATDGQPSTQSKRDSKLATETANEDDSIASNDSRKGSDDTNGIERYKINKTDRRNSNGSDQQRTSISDHLATEHDNTASQVHNGDASAPVAVFKQTRGRGMRRSFRFDGFYYGLHIAYLEPHSPELVRMLEQKWSRIDRHGKVVMRERDHASWQESLGLRWAVVKFARHEEADRQKGVPRIERLSDSTESARGGAVKKSVNEMLQEMRLQEGFAKYSGDAA